MARRRRRRVVWGWSAAALLAAAAIAVPIGVVYGTKAQDTADIALDESRAYDGGFVYGDAAPPTDTVPPNRAGYDRSVAYEAVDDRGTKAIGEAELPQLPAGSQFTATWTYTPRDEGAGRPFKVVHTYAVAPRRLNAANVEAALGLAYLGEIITPGRPAPDTVSTDKLLIPSADAIPEGYQKTESGPAEYIVVTTVEPGSVEATPEFPFSSGDRFFADDRQFVQYLRSMPYGTVVTRTFSFAPDQNHAGAAFEYKATYTIDAQREIAGIATAESKTAKAGSDDVKEVEYSSLPNAGTTLFRYSGVRYEITVDPEADSGPSFGETINLATARQLPAGYGFKQVYETTLSNKNYKLAKFYSNQSHTVNWTVV